MKKLFLTLVMLVALSCVLAFAVSAESVHEGRVDLDATVTLNDGSVCSLFDSEGNALIWYKDLNGSLASIRADDSRVKYIAATWTVNINGITGPEMIGVRIDLEEGSVSSSNIVVFNIMDDDVVTNECSNSKYLNMRVTCMKEFIRSSTNLEYVYLRLDTIAVMANAFSGCKNLKYVNLEDLTELGRIGGGSTFNSCSSLFKDTVLDLTRTKLTSIDGGGVFAGTAIAGIKVPDTLTTIGTWAFQSCQFTEFAFPVSFNKIPDATFKSCKSLTTVYINNTVLSIGGEAFRDAGALKTVFFVGTRSELNALLDNTSTSSNSPFLNVAGANRENLISYEEYLALEDKSGKYMVYGYSYCEAFNEGNHRFSGKASLTIKSYFEAIRFMDTCTVEGCGASAEDTSRRIAPLFAWKGYSRSMYGDAYSIAQCFYVNKTAIDIYMEYSPEFDYGVLATGNASGGPIKPQLDGEKVHVGNFVKGVNDYVIVKVTGITSALTSAKIVFCAYVIDNGVLYYLDGGVTADSVVGVSYDEIV